MPIQKTKEELLEENRQLRDQVRDRYRFENIIGDAPAMHEVFATLENVVGLHQPLGQEIQE